MLRTALLPLLVLGLGACRTTDSATDPKAVFGVDERQSLSTANPFDSVAHLDTANGGTCTAFMVGPRIGLTAGHCTEGVANGGTMTMQFRGDYGASVTLRLLERGSSSYTGNVYDDWAIFVLDGGVESNQWLGYADGLSIGDPLHLSGYSADINGASTTDHCSARNISDGIIYHDCDMQGGASGGPIFISANDTWYAVGIQSGHHGNGQSVAHHAEWAMSNSNLGALLTTSMKNRIGQYRVTYPGASGQ